jgi:hypothetical protein
MLADDFSQDAVELGPRLLDVTPGFIRPTICKC